MNFHIRILRWSAVLTIALVASPSRSEEFRTWTDKASGRQIEAAMVSVDLTAGTVVIQMKTGQQYTMPLARLVDEDVAYAKQKAMPAPGAPPAPATTPATPGAPAAPAAPAAKPSPAAAAPPKGQPAPPRPELKILPLKGFKAPSGQDFTRSIQKVRPRLIHTAQGWAYLKGLPAADPIAAKLLENLKKSGETLLEKPEITRVYGTEMGPVNPATQAVCRMAALGVLHYVEGDPKWKERAVREVTGLTDPAFGDWYCDEANVTKDLVLAACLGYDWFKDGFNAGQLAKLREYIDQKGVDVLVAKLKGEPAPETARVKAPGTVAAKDDKPKPTKKADEEGPEIIDEEHMSISAVLIMAAICMADDDPAVSKKALEAVGRTFSKGVAQFSPGGVWPEGLETGDVVMDYVAMVLQTLRSCGGGDFGLSLLEGIPQTGPARLHFVGPSRTIFNYGDSRGAALTRSWVSNWLSGVHGNPGLPAASPGTPQAETAAHLGLAGHFLYLNPHALGYGTSVSFDYVTAGGELAALRSAWDDPKALYIAFKGGNNEVPAAQLDIGSFVLEGGGVRWAVELGMEGDRVSGYDPAPDRTKRYNFYLAGTKGQNTLVMGGGKEEPEEKPDPKKSGGKAPPPVPAPGNQELDAKAAFIGFNSTPEKGVAILDMSDAYRKAKAAHRGAMMVRGQQPYVLLQDDLQLKGTTDVEWKLHTKSDVAATGNKATFTQGKSTLTAVLLSPAGAQFVVEDPPEKPAGEERMRDLRREKVKVLKVKLTEVKGEQRITVAFAAGAEPPAAPVVPLTEWLPKK